MQSHIVQNRWRGTVKGNDYRLEVTVAYKIGVVVVKWLGTHAEYDERSARR